MQDEPCTWIYALTAREMFSSQPHAQNSGFLHLEAAHDMTVFPQSHENYATQRNKYCNPSLRAALFAPRSNPESAMWIPDCFGAKEAPRNDGLKHLFLRLSFGHPPIP